MDVRVQGYWVERLWDARPFHSEHEKLQAHLLRTG